jgi:hypothetical protein
MGHGSDQRDRGPAGKRSGDCVSSRARVPCKHLATLTAADIHMEEGIATITTTAGTTTLLLADYRFPQGAS